MTSKESLSWITTKISGKRVAIDNQGSTKKASKCETIERKSSFVSGLYTPGHTLLGPYPGGSKFRLDSKRNELLGCAEFRLENQ